MKNNNNDKKNPLLKAHVWFMVSNVTMSLNHNKNIYGLHSR